jgi:very-short-patch-repair endonuclease/predicted transcriptional regulator of viral defense system
VSNEACISNRIGGKCRPQIATKPEETVDRLLAEVAERQHGVASRRQLLEMGVGVGAIEGRLRRGALHRLQHGVYAVGHGSVTRDGRLMAAVLACGTDAVLSHRSAGQLWRLIPPAPALPEVSRPRKFRQREGLVCHRASFRADEIDTVDGLPVTSPFRTLFDLAALLSKRELERALHEAEVAQLTDRVSLPQLIARYPGRRGVANLRALLADNEPVGITRNDFEELFVALVDEYDLSRPRFNATLPLRGRLLEPDAMWPAAKLLVELDGRAVHGTRSAFESDRQRDRILLAEGWRSLRVTWRQLQDEPGAIAADLRLLLRAGAPAPTL